MRRILHTLPAAAALAAGMGLSSASLAEDKVVTLWHTEPNPRTVAVMDATIAKYEAMNPGIKIKQEPIAWGNLDTKLQAALAAGAPPDASHGQAYVERSLSAKGLLVPVNAIYDSIGEDDLYDVVKRLNCHPDGNCYGIAHAVGTDLIVYRKDFYREAGLDPEKPAATWAEWLEQLKALTVDTDGDGKNDRFGLGLAGPGFFINEEVYMWTGSNGGRLFADNHRPTFTEAPVLEMLAFWKELADCCLAPDWLSHGYLDTFAMLATGKVASIYGWGRGTDYFEKYAPEAVDRGDIGIFPSKPIGPSGTEFLTQFDCEPWMVFKDGKHPQEAIDFLKFFYQPENYLPYIQSVPIHFFPIRKSMQADPAYLATAAFEKWGGWRDAQLNVIQNHDPKPLMITEWDDLELPFVQELASSGILIDMVTDVVDRDVSPTDAAARAQERAEELITQLGYKNW